MQIDRDKLMIYEMKNIYFLFIWTKLGVVDNVE